jgi:hypothetical protein
MRDLAVLFLPSAGDGRPARRTRRRPVRRCRVCSRQAATADPVHGELQILEHFWGLREVVIRLAGGGELDSKGGDHRESVPVSCRLEDATSGNTQQQEQLPATPGNSTGTPLLTGGLLVRIQPEEPIFSAYGDCDSAQFLLMSCTVRSRMVTRAFPHELSAV